MRLNFHLSFIFTVVHLCDLPLALHILIAHIFLEDQWHSLLHITLFPSTYHWPQHILETFYLLEVIHPQSRPTSLSRPESEFGSLGSDLQTMKRKTLVLLLSFVQILF